MTFFIPSLTLLTMKCFLLNPHSDIKNIKKSNRIVTFTDKEDDLYELDKNLDNQLLNNTSTIYRKPILHMYNNIDSGEKK